MAEPPVYLIDITPAADRDLRKLQGHIQKQDFDRLARGIDRLAGEPRPRGVRKIEGAGSAYRIRVRSYRVVYDIYDEKKLVLILQVIRRNETTYKY